MVQQRGLAGNGDRRRNLRTVISTYDPNGFALGVGTNLQVLEALRETVGN